MANTLLQRIAALPTARRGDETIVLVPMNELVALIGDAQTGEALQRAFDRRSR